MNPFLATFQKCSCAKNQKPCITWNSVYNISISSYKNMASVDNNFCANPDNDELGIWCYTEKDGITSGGLGYEYCSETCDCETTITITTKPKTYPTKTYPTKTYPTKTYPTKIYPTKTYPTKIYPTKTYPTKIYPTTAQVLLAYFNFCILNIFFILNDPIRVRKLCFLHFFLFILNHSG